MRFLLVLCLLPCFVQTRSYFHRREKIIKKELKMSIGGSIILNAKEELANKLLMKWKHEELDKAYNDSVHFPLTKSYLEFKDVIKQSKVYKFLEAMPKGAALHEHINSVLNADFFMNVTYKDHLYVCLQKDIIFKFSYVKPTENCNTKWELMSDVRNSVENVTKFDLELRTKFSLEQVKTFDVDVVWKKFHKIFSTIYPLWSHRPVCEQYVENMLQAFYNDNVMYVELRSSVPLLYELDGSEHDDVYFINTIKTIADQFKRDHPDFLGIKMIMSFYRHIDTKLITSELEQTKRLKEKFPDFVAGFDLVGYEDGGYSLLDFVSPLNSHKNDLNYFFHAGETDWYGMSTDENLIDAILLGTKRIGHGYALAKHPELISKIKARKIGIEVNVVSNNVLNYVHDMRNHPLAMFISLGLPVVLSSDDPGFWDAKPLTTDFYVAFVCVASRLHDLRLLKQLAYNSLEYSALKNYEKVLAKRMFEYKWKDFIDDFLKKHNHLR